MLRSSGSRSPAAIPPIRRWFPHRAWPRLLRSTRDQSKYERPVPRPEKGLGQVKALALEAREPEDGHERVHREAPRHEEHDKPHPAGPEAR